MVKITNIIITGENNHQILILFSDGNHYLTDDFTDDRRKALELPIGKEYESFLDVREDVRSSNLLLERITITE